MGRPRRSEKARRPGRRDAWREAAAALGGELEEGRKESEDVIRVADDAWTVVVRTFTVMVGQVPVTYTSARALFLARSEIKLIVRKRGMFDKLAAGLGFGSTLRGNPMLARRYVVKGRPESRRVAVVTPSVTELLLKHEALRLEVKNADRKERRALGNGAKQVVVMSAGVVRDAARLADMARLAYAELDALEACGLAVSGPLEAL